MENVNQDSPLHLADALVDEIANTPAEALLGEVAEDLGDRRALASEFDTVFARTLRQSRRKQLSIALKNVGVWLSQRLFGKPILVRVGTLAALVIAVVSYHYHDARRATPSPSPQAQSDLRNALAAYDTARAYQARDRATDAWNRGDYATAIVSLNDALRSCANRCRLELRGELGYDLERAQGALKTANPAAVAANPQSAVNAATAVPPAKSSPSLSWPVKGRITVNFGTGATALAQSHAQMETAEGISIAVPEGADIRAAADGVVSYVGPDKASGNFLLIRHDDDLTTGYGHLRRVLVKAYNQVHRGEVIAKGVVSGRGAQPELYFEVRKGIVPVDPMQYLPQDQQQ